MSHHPKYFSVFFCLSLDYVENLSRTYGKAAFYSDHESGNWSLNLIIPNSMHITKKIAPHT